MSIQHKAYLFNYDTFEEELAALLYKALEDNNIKLLEQFIQQHRVKLIDFDTCEPLDEDWKNYPEENQDIQWYADIALTKYYDCIMGDLGLSYGFDALSAYLESLPPIQPEVNLLICGHLWGPSGHRLDPGSMGTGLLSPTEVERLCGVLKQSHWAPIPQPESDIYAECLYKPESVEEVRNALVKLQQLYAKASKEQKGLLFQDFNDRGVAHL